MIRNKPVRTIDDFPRINKALRYCSDNYKPGSAKRLCDMHYKIAFNFYNNSVNLLRNSGINSELIDFLVSEAKEALNEHGRLSRNIIARSRL